MNMLQCLNIFHVPVFHLFYYSFADVIYVFNKIVLHRIASHLFDDYFSNCYLLT